MDHRIPRTTSPARPAAGPPAEVEPLGSGRSASLARPAGSPSARAPGPGAAARPVPRAALPPSRAQEFQAVPPDYLRAALQNDQALRGRLEHAGVAVVRNTGGDDNNLCLLSALLQAAGVPLHDVEQRARGLRDQLAGQPDALGQALGAGLGLYANRDVFQPLVARIFADRPQTPMLVMTAGQQGAPLLFNPLWAHGAAQVDPATVPSHTVVLLESPGHFEFVANASGRPWSAVLAQLEAPAAPELAPAPAWRRVSIDTFDRPGRPDVKRHLQLPPQVAISPTGLAENAPPVEQARALAAAQERVDAVWFAMRHLSSIERERPVALGAGVVERRLAVYLAAATRPAQGASETPSLVHVNLQERGRRVVGMSITGPQQAGIEVRYADPDVQGAPLRPALSAQQRQWLVEALQACRPHEGESPIQFARRLTHANRGLNDHALAQASGASVSSVRNDRMIHPPQIGRGDKEKLDLAEGKIPHSARKPGIEFARLLRAVDPDLSDEAVATRSQVPVVTVRGDRKASSSALPAGQPAYAAKLKRAWDEDRIVQTAATVRQRTPRLEKETQAAYARRLHQQDRSLDVRTLAEASGVLQASLAKDPRVVTPELSPNRLSDMEAAKLACPRKEREFNIAYARRLHAHDGRLGIEALARASGTSISKVLGDPTINPHVLSDDEQDMLAASLQAVPQAPGEASIDYMMRLTTHQPRLSDVALANGSGVTIAAVRSRLAQAALSADAESTRPA